MDAQYDSTNDLDFGHLYESFVESMADVQI